jgi:cytochrome c peroxidase
MSFIYTRLRHGHGLSDGDGGVDGIASAQRGGPALAQGMRLVSMSFDPEQRHARAHGAYSALAQGRKSAADWRFVTTASQAQLQPILAAYGQAVDRKQIPTTRPAR